MYSTEKSSIFSPLSKLFGFLVQKKVHCKEQIPLEKDMTDLATAACWIEMLQLEEVWAEQKMEKGIQRQERRGDSATREKRKFSIKRDNTTRERRG